MSMRGDSGFEVISATGTDSSVASLVSALSLREMPDELMMNRTSSSVIVGMKAIASDALENEIPGSPMCLRLKAMLSANVLVFPTPVITIVLAPLSFSTR